MSKLLNKPFRAFTLYALIILVCSTPVYYLVVDYIWLSELDEHNQIIKEQIVSGFEKTKAGDAELTQLLEFWNAIEPGTKITSVTHAASTKDSVYVVSRETKLAGNIEIDRFRGLISYIQINGNTYQLTIETNVEETDETLLAIAVITVLFFILLVTGFILLNKRIARKIWQPFRNTLEKLKAFDITKHQNIEFEKSDIEEFEELNIELTKVIEKNVSAFNQQKAFIENASHELQTPLALLKSKIDLLIQSKELTNEQSQIITSINGSLSRVSRINKNLLLLAKIENMQFPDRQPIEVSMLLRGCLEPLADYIVEKGFSFEEEINQQFIINCNNTLLEILVNNLLINAIQHNTEKGKIGMGLNNGILCVYNSGVTALNTANIFKRFSQSSAETANSGLGLAIAKEICNRYGWKISYSFANNLHKFSVEF